MMISVPCTKRGELHAVHVTGTSADSTNADRAEIEADYAKRLSKLAKQNLGKDETG